MRRNRVALWNQLNGSRTSVDKILSPWKMPWCVRVVDVIEKMACYFIEKYFAYVRERRWCVQFYFFRVLCARMKAKCAQWVRASAPTQQQQHQQKKKMKNNLYMLLLRAPCEWELSCGVCNMNNDLMVMRWALSMYILSNDFRNNGKICFPIHNSCVFPSYPIRHFEHFESVWMQIAPGIVGRTLLRTHRAHFRATT